MHVEKGALLTNGGSPIIISVARSVVARVRCHSHYGPPTGPRGRCASKIRFLATISNLKFIK